MSNITKNYELLLMFDVNQDDAETISTVDKYKSTIESKGGSIDRHEDWGVIKMAYMIDKNNKARYILLNFQSTAEVLEELSNLIKFNDSIIRHLFTVQSESITEPSIMMQSKERTA
tara:strand:- start:166 stop:513 length:348 start_codon:yes stop_codon:yes gene_type:complete